MRDGAVSALRSVAATALRLVVLAVLVAGLFPAGRVLAQSAGPDAAGTGQATAIVYVFRAMGGKFVTREMDNLATKIEARGFDVQIFNYTGWMRPAKDAIKRYKADSVKPRIIALGHSAGGDSAIRFALSLKRANVPVDLIITLDPTRIANRVPANVGVLFDD